MVEIASAAAAENTGTQHPSESAISNSDNLLWISFDDKVAEATETRQTAVVTRLDCSMELKLYCNDPIARKEDPLLWWKTNTAKYPNLTAWVSLPRLYLPKGCFQKLGS